MEYKQQKNDSHLIRLLKYLFLSQKRREAARCHFFLPHVFFQLIFFLSRSDLITKIRKKQKQNPPTMVEKSRKKQEIVMHQVACEFDFGNEKVGIAQLVPMVVNLQEEVQKLKIMNEKLILKLEQIEQREDLNEARLMSYQREMQTFWNFQKEQDRQIMDSLFQIFQKLKKIFFCSLRF